MNVYLKNYLRGLALGTGMSLLFVIYSSIFHQLLPLWIAIPFAILPYILLLIPSCYASLITRPTTRRGSTYLENVPSLQRLLVTAFVIGHFSAICGMAFIATLLKIAQWTYVAS
ncbi:hypothetical protein KBD61_00835 [Patescibacteria group bacterium]|nr:hypothetical protein [Patescibacteria group bacterium]MBP9709553.1 hypothetical protein [Patescibacteria group bacterium]